jgi:hypothetical protein
VGRQKQKKGPAKKVAKKDKVELQGVPAKRRPTSKGKKGR